MNETLTLSPALTQALAQTLISTGARNKGKPTKHPAHLGACENNLTKITIILLFAAAWWVVFSIV